MAISSISATPALQDVARTNGESVLRSNVQTPAAVQSSQATSQTTETVSAPAAPATSEQILQALSDVQTALQPANHGSLNAILSACNSLWIGHKSYS